MKIGISQGQFPPEDEVISNKQPILLGFFSSFNYFCCSYLGKGENRAPEERIQKETLAIFGIGDPLERLMKIITNTG